MTANNEMERRARQPVDPSKRADLVAELAASEPLVRRENGPRMITVELTSDERTALLVAARVAQDSHEGQRFLTRRDREAIDSARRKLNEAQETR